MPRGKKTASTPETLQATLKESGVKLVKANLKNLKNIASLVKLNPTTEQKQKIVAALEGGLDTVKKVFAAPPTTPTDPGFTL
jgi:hypothetical protein